MTEQYERTIWVNGETPLNKTNMDHIEIGISNNSADISVLKGDMKFKGVVNVLPTEDVEIGNVYQAGASGLCDLNKIGDLLVCTEVNPLTWHVIPSGDETSGTVTSVSAGAGLTGGTITGSGTLSLDANYTANANRNGLLSSNYFQKLDEIDYELAVNRDYERLQNVPEQLRLLQIEQTMGNSENWVMSQQATTTALNNKSDEGHHHAISDIDTDRDLEALIDNKSDLNHTHGVITANGHVQVGSGNPSNQYLKTDDNGLIVPTPTISSGAIDGDTIGGISVGSLKTRLDKVETTLTADGSNWKKSATADHVHGVFTSSAAGFAPKAPAEDAGDYLLSGDGTWKSSVEVSSITALIDTIYPPGAYYETSDPNFSPSGSHWPGTWVLENEGLFHVSGNATSTAYKCDATTGANKSTETVIAGTGIADGGEDFHKLTSKEAAQKDINNGTAVAAGNHAHSMKTIWSDGSGSKDAYKFDSKRKLTTRYTDYAGNHSHTVKITGSDAQNAHENRPPYVCVFRWHRTG